MSNAFKKWDAYPRLSVRIQAFSPSPQGTPTMTAVLKSASRITAAAVAAVAVAATGAGAAAADIPGEYRVTEVFPVDDQRIQLAIDGPNLANGTVSGSVQNNTGSPLTCKGIAGGPAGTVVPDHIVARSVDFYAQFPYSPLAPLVIGVDGPGFDDQQFELGSVAALAPGSLAEMLWPDLAALQVISSSYDEARLGGHVGTTGTSMTVPARESEPFTVQLGNPSAGGWQDFNTGIMLTCVLEEQRYVFHGYENGRPADLPEPSGETGRFTGS